MYRRSGEGGEDVKRKQTVFPDKKFTIIELLVVISILAILCTILLPVLNSARGKAEEILCKSNLKAIAFAAASYSSDNADWIHPHSSQNTQYFWPKELSLYGALYSYDRTRASNFHCPSERRNVPGRSGYHATDYGLNNSVSGFYRAGYSAKENMIKRLSQFKNIARLPFIVDTGGRDGSRIRFRTTEFAYIHGGDDWRAPSNLSSGWEVADALSLRGRSGMAFLDGHLESRTFPSLLKGNDAYFYITDGNNIPEGPTNF